VLRNKNINKINFCKVFVSTTEDVQIRAIEKKKSKLNILKE